MQNKKFSDFLNCEREWYRHGERHREDGPAYESSDGYKAWYIHDKRHREDGPAVEYADGSKYWFINDKQLTEEEFRVYRL